ncbi:MAG TPA: carbamoyl phosphate synthase small subunit, partial [Leptospiraceae bacterium]|nr:carbamoyl phosphate synthase small subunit [Leptospiraceae bacterium]
VKNYSTGRVEITAQNHGFAVVGEDSSAEPITHINLNDQTIEGIRSSSLPVMAVQYHPESSPGPHDAEYLFTEFFELVKKSKS